MERMIANILILVWLVRPTGATRTVPASAVVTVRDEPHYDELRRRAPQHAIFFFDPSCAKCAQQAKAFTKESRNLIDRDILPIRIDASRPHFDSLRRRLRIGGAPKFVFRNESSTPHRTQRFRNRENFTMSNWIDTLGSAADHRQYTLTNSHIHVTNPRKTHVILFLNPHATSEHHHQTIRAFRRALADAPSSIHHYYTHFDGEHHHLLNEFGLLQHTGHPDYHHDRIIFACRDRSGQMKHQHALELLPHTDQDLAPILSPHWDRCADVD